MAKDVYVKQRYNTIGHKENDVYSCLGDSNYTRYYGEVYNYIEEDSRGYMLPTRTDKNFYGTSSLPSGSVIMFSNAITKVNREYYSGDYYPISIGIYGIPFGFDCMNQLTRHNKYVNYSSSWVYFNGSPFYLNNNDILQGIDIKDYNKWEFIMKAYTMGIVKHTDEEGNVRTFQCCGVLRLYVSSSVGSGFRYCPVFRQYKKGPQAQWSRTFIVDSYYTTKIEVIDNDGNPVDFENGGLIVSHDKDYFTSLWRTHKNEMNV